MYFKVPCSQSANLSKILCTPFVVYFFPFRNEFDLKKSDSGTYSEKLLGLSVIETVSRSWRICEPFNDAVDAAFVDFIANPSGINPQSEQENSDLIDEIIKNTGIISDQENNNKEEEHTHENVGVGISSFAIRKMIRSLNETQKEVFDFVSKWTREYIKLQTVTLMNQ